MEKLEKTIADNLTFLRKNAGLTQLEFGEKFNYSDKTISKWELGVAIPSVEVLKQIADFYGVSIDYLVTEHKSQKDFASSINKTVKPREKILLILLMVTVIFTIAAVIYVAAFLKFHTVDPQINRFWVTFLWAIPLSILISAFFTYRYFKGSISTYILASAFVWTILAVAYVTFLYKENYWFVFFIGIPVQTGIILIRQIFKGK